MPDYALNHMSRAEVEAMLGAIGRRYKRQADAMKQASQPGSRARPPTQDEVRTNLSGNVSTSIADIARSRNPALLKAFNISHKGRHGEP